jgi:hypothetical protein
MNFTKGGILKAQLRLIAACRSDLLIANVDLHATSGRGSVAKAMSRSFNSEIHLW